MGNSEELKKFFRRALNDKDLPRGARDGLEALFASHSTTGQRYRIQGRLREAIEEFRKDTLIDIVGYDQAMVAENAFCLMGDTYLELGETESAIGAFEEALRLWRQYGYGSDPHVSLAELYLKQGRIEDAISLCEEVPEHRRGWGERQVLEEAHRRSSEGETEGSQ